MLHAVIMAGGSGTRFWPASRRSHPKQLLSIGTARPLVEETVNRISGLVPPERILIVTNEQYARMTGRLLNKIPEENVIGEPLGRDTAACIGLAALIVRHRDPDAVMAVMPSDHIIKPPEAFCATLEAAEAFLDDNRDALLTFGIEPTFPSTGYGYIKRGKPVAESRAISFFEVDTFREKPTLDVAEAFLREGGYLWNAGIFLWRADVLIENMARHLPDLYRDLSKLEPVIDGKGFVDALAAAYPSLQQISIDYGIMEKAKRRCVASVSYRWDDVGSWDALERLIPPDEAGNRVEGTCHAVDAKDNIVSARGGMVGLVGVEGLVVVHTPDATLVCRKEDAEAVKRLVEGLGEEYR
jgi:mannose-1-phosphate guanylyltransferase